MANARPQVGPTSVPVQIAVCTKERDPRATFNCPQMARTALLAVVALLSIAGEPRQMPGPVQSAGPRDCAGDRHDGI